MAFGRLGTEMGRLGRLLDEGVVANLPDEQLLDRFAARRDGSAFEALVQRHGPMVLATCRGALKDQHAAEDAFQATFLTLARKAKSLRSADSLAPWLHRVARRISARANAAAERRRRLERARPAVDLVDPRPMAGGGPEDWPILHEEIDRLPERYRAPIVLCYLEGMTYEQAAGHLRWPVGTVGGRLARARELIRGRLIRRGVTASLATLAATSTPALAAVPAGWTRATVTAATGGLASAGATWMTHLMLRGLLVTKLNTASLVGLAALILAFGGLVVAGLQEPPKVNPVRAPTAIVPSGKAPASESVRVVDPDGRPVAGARVYQSPTRFRSPDRAPFAAMKLAETGPDGVFPIAREVARGATDHELNVVAMVDGFGPAFGFGPSFADPARVGDGMKQLQLARDDVPIQGRVLDIEGRPVAGAVVQLVGIRWSLTGTLDEWLDAMKAEKAANTVTNRLLRSWSSDDIPTLYQPITTDPTGRFTLKGVGRQRVAMLVLSGPGIETRFECVATRAMPTVGYPPFANRSTRPARDIQFHGASFEHVAGPGLEVTGTVRDQETGRPLAGIAIQAQAPFGNPIRFLTTTTDPEGRYRLAGVALKDDYGQAQGIVASSKAGPPYLSTAQPIREGRGTITRDFGLKRGIWACGKVIDQETGLPLTAGVNYFIPEDNPYLKDYPGYGTVRISPGLEADEQGEFKLVVIPGRGILAARLGSGPYRMAVGSDKLAGMKSARPGMPPFLPAQPTQLNPLVYNTLVEINPKPGDESVAVDIRLDRGRTVRGTILGPDGEPVVGAWVMGAARTDSWSVRPLPSAEFEVQSLGPDDRRGLVFWEEAKGLAGAHVIQPGEPGPLTIKLQTSATWTGRLIDDEGQPLVGVEIRCNGRSPLNEGESRFEQGILPRNQPIKTDPQGRFRVVGIVPGLKYTLWVVKELGKVQVVLQDRVAGPGEAKDLGDVRPMTPRRP